MLFLVLFFLMVCSLLTPGDKVLWSCSKFCVLQRVPFPSLCSILAVRVQASVHCEWCLRKSQPVPVCCEQGPVGFLLWSLSTLGIPVFGGQLLGFSPLWLFIETVPRHLPPICLPPRRLAVFSGKNLACLSESIMLIIDVSVVLSAELASGSESSIRSEAGSQQLLFKH